MVEQVLWATVDGPTPLSYGPSNHEPAALVFLHSKPLDPRGIRPSKSFVRTFASHAPASLEHASPARPEGLSLRADAVPTGGFAATPRPRGPGSGAQTWGVGVDKASGVVGVVWLDGQVPNRSSFCWTPGIWVFVESILIHFFATPICSHIVPGPNQPQSPPHKRCAFCRRSFYSEEEPVRETEKRRGGLIWIGQRIQSWVIDAHS